MPYGWVGREAYISSYVSYVGHCRGAVVSAAGFGLDSGIMETRSSSPKPIIGGLHQLSSFREVTKIAESPRADRWISRDIVVRGRDEPNLRTTCGRARRDRLSFPPATSPTTSVLPGAIGAIRLDPTRHAVDPGSGRRRPFVSAPPAEPNPSVRSLGSRIATPS